MYKKSKLFFENFFDKFELSLINLLVKIRTNFKFRKERKKNYYVYDKQYKKRILKYWKQFGIKINPMYHFQYATTNNLKDVRFIPDYLWFTKIMDYYSNRKYAIGVNDKNYYEVLFKDFKQPKTIFRKINGIYYDSKYKMISERQAIELCKKYNRLIFKPSIDNGGSYGIVFWDTSQDIESVVKSYNQNNYIVQEIVKQHKDIAKFNSTSLNTIRITSFIINNNVNILAASLRMGVNNSLVDNASVGGIFVALNLDGTFHKVAYNIYGEKFDKHPNGTIFEGNIIPNFELILDKIKEVHEKMGHFRLISWDTTINEKGEPILIEANFRNGGVRLHQYDSGPIFGDLTDQVLEEVFGRK